MRDGVLTLEKMFFADEIRPNEGIAPEDAAVDKKQLAMAIELIKNYTGEFEPDKYKDTYREKLLALIEQKRDGKEVKQVAAEPETTAAPDLLAALQASLAGVKKGRDTPARKPAKAASERTAAAGGRKRKSG